jgi:hypothetical protein
MNCVLRPKDSEIGQKQKQKKMLTFFQANLLKKCHESLDALCVFDLKDESSVGPRNID